jgi:hypothetical protein
MMGLVMGRRRQALMMMGRRRQALIMMGRSVLEDNGVIDGDGEMRMGGWEYTVEQKSEPHH